MGLQVALGPQLHRVGLEFSHSSHSGVFSGGAAPGPQATCHPTWRVPLPSCYSPDPSTIQEAFPGLPPASLTACVGAAGRLTQPPPPTNAPQASLESLSGLWEPPVMGVADLTPVSAPLCLPASDREDGRSRCPRSQLPLQWGWRDAPLATGELLAPAFAASL